jgi:SAM-dependent methyltransferase
METNLPASGRGHTLLNLGCGEEGHPAFVNIDLRAANPGIIAHDLRDGIPFPDETFDLVYHATMLSMLRSASALRLMQECRRVLKPGGVLRVVTEDLEQMCQAYLQKLEAVCNGNTESADDYEWMILELYDQATRESSGGGMVQYLLRDPLPNEAFIYSRIGAQGTRIVSGLRLRPEPKYAAPANETVGVRAKLMEKVNKFVLTALLGPKSVEALEIGLFRLTAGQVSYRMYDRYSLGRLFQAAGFSQVSRRTPTESGYAFWDRVNLDVSVEGRIVRPHTLIMEGTCGDNPARSIV